MKPISIVLLAAAMSLAGQAAPPSIPEAVTVKDDFYGTEVRDPYRHFEDRGNEAVDAWSRAAAAHANEALSQLTHSKRVREIIKEVTDRQGDDASDIQRFPGETLYFLMRKKGEDQPRLYRKRAHGDAKLILDPATLSPGAKDPSIKYFSVSPDERHLAVCVTSGGSENGTLRFVNLGSGKTVDGPIERARWGPGSWTDDGNGYFYSQLQKLGPEADPQQTFQRSTICIHRLGSPVADDLAIWGVDVKGAPPVAPSDISFPIIVPGTGWLMIYNSTGVSADYAITLGRLDGVLSGKPEWRKFSEREDLLGAFRGGTLAWRGKDLYVITRKDAPNGKVVRVDLETLDPERAETVYAPERGVIQQLLDTREGIYVRVLEGGPSRLILLPNGAMDKPREIELPEAGRVMFHGGETCDPRLEGLYITLRSWTKPPRHYRVGPKSGVAERIHLGEEDEPEICAELVSRQIMVPSHDGVEVPVSIVHRKDLDPDKTHPVFLTAYGAYGITIEPSFYPSDAALIELGGIKAVAHVRGGGAFGETWRLAGYQATKPNTWKDLIAASRGLVELGLTTPGQIGIMGGSAGGITVGRAITEAPDTFGAAVINVGVCDAVRMETTPNGIPNIPEFGSVKTKKGFEALLEMSAYHKVKDGTAYPPVLISHGANDTRVELWHSQKMAARLAEATTDGPVLLRIDYHAGHGGGSSVDQSNALYGDMVTFILEHCR